METPTGLRLPYRTGREGRKWRRSRVSLFVVLVAVGIGSLAAAVDRSELPKDEVWEYAVRYKYGLVVMRAGNARYRIRAAEYKGRPAVGLSLTFRTNAFFDKIFPIRDTLASYASALEERPLYHIRSVNEGHTRFVEEMWTEAFGDDFTKMRVKRTAGGKVRIDTLLEAPNLGYDFMNVFLFLRGLDYKNLSPGYSRQLTTFAGEKKTNLILRYAGATTLKRGNGRSEKTFLLVVDIADEVFSESKNAMEIWISDDARHLPLKMKAKLKIGAAEAELL
jgi:hypothetical protein